MHVGGRQLLSNNRASLALQVALPSSLVDHICELLPAAGRAAERFQQPVQDGQLSVKLCMQM